MASSCVRHHHHTAAPEQRHSGALLYTTQHGRPTLSSPDEVANLVGHLDAPGPAEAAVHDILHHLAGQDARLPLFLQQQKT